MLYAALKLLHVWAIVAWVGGMAFAHFFLRPSLTVLDPPLRLRLMAEVLRRFFAAMTAAVAVALVTGAAMIELTAGRVEATGGRLVMPFGWTAMTVIGILMALIFALIRLRLYPPLRRAVEAADWPAAAEALARVRRWVLVNLVLGVAVIGLAIVG